VKTSTAGQRHILVVDDEPLVCQTVTILLKFDGHQVTAVSSGEEALAIFEPGKFDLVITDFAMPSMNGRQVAEAIKSRAPGQAVGLFTAHAERLRGDAETLKLVDFLIEKPVDLDSLRDAVNRFPRADSKN
jgi:CheY-like chemotaxis protein